MAAAPILRSIALAGLMLAACTDAPEPSPDTPVSSGVQPVGAGTPTSTEPSGPAQPSDCNAPKAERFVGRNADAATRAELAAAVAPTTTIRWVGPGDATTEDYSTSRLNVMLDVGGTSRSAHCG